MSIDQMSDYIDHRRIRVAISSPAPAMDCLVLRSPNCCVKISLVARRLSQMNRRRSKQRSSYDLQPKPPHHAAKAKSVIQLFMNGGPSQMDLFDPKPVLNRMDGKPYPGNVEEIGNQDAATLA